MKSELKIVSSSWRVSLVIGISLTVTIIVAMFVFQNEFRLILLGGSGLIGLGAFLFILYQFKQLSYGNTEKQLDLAIRRQELRLITLEADQKELQSKFLIVSRNERAIYLNGHLDNFGIIDVTPEPVKALPLPEDKPVVRQLLDIPFTHMLLVGGTGVGKTTLMNHIIDNFPYEVKILVADPHAKFNEWSNRAEVVGTGWDFKSINTLLDSLLDEMKRRYQGDELEFQPIALIADEWLSIANHPDVTIATEFFRLVGSQARKAGIHLILGSQSSTVEDLAIKGSGQLRDNFLQVFLTEQLKHQNMAKVQWGNGESEIVELPGVYIPNGSRFFNRKPDTDQLFIQDVKEGMSQNQLLDRYFRGMRRQDAIAALKAKKAQNGL